MYEFHIFTLFMFLKYLTCSEQFGNIKTGMKYQYYAN